MKIVLPAAWDSLMAERGYAPLETFKLKSNMLPDAPRPRVKPYARPGDMAEQILDKTKHPEWNGERCKMIYQFPRNEELWERYADLRVDELRECGTFERATEFYREHQAEMDEGAVAASKAHR